MVQTYISLPKKKKNPKYTDVGMKCRVLAEGKRYKKIADVFSK